MPAAKLPPLYLKLLREFRQNAETRYKTGVGPQQDVLQADVELARQEERLVALRRARLVTVARINTLMHTSPDAPLPPPAEIRSEAALPDAANLRSLAVQNRPDLKAATRDGGGAQGPDGRPFRQRRTAERAVSPCLQAAYRHPSRLP